MIKEKNQWVYNDINIANSSDTAENIETSDIAVRVLMGRGITDIEEIKRFLNPSIKELKKPLLLEDMRRAVNRIADAIEKKEKILIYGDYDVDGVTSTALLYNFFTNIGAEVSYYIPDRIEEGYGLSISAIDKILKNKVDLIVTVDCGITAFEEVEYIKKHDIDVIITDHHECKKELPKASAVINPHRHDDSYPFKELAGVGVAYKLAEAYADTMNIKFMHEDYLDIVALGTIADVVPLIGENRIIAKFGLEKMKNTYNLGLKTLIEKSNIKKELNSWTVSFVIAPKINAAGRIGYAGRAVKLLITKDTDEANSLADEFICENKYRQETEQCILNDAYELIKTQIDIDKDKVIVLCGDEWHHGVIGIVASRIMEKYYKPCILLSNENGISKGSARSIKGFNLFEALCVCNDLLEKYGGHELAAGLTIKTDNIEAFRKKINKYADEILNVWDMTPKVNIDVVIDKNELDIQKVNELQKLEPYGAANPSPVIACNGLKIIDKKTLSDKKHLKMLLGNGSFFVDTIGFNMGHYYDELGKTDILDIACAMEINNWNNMQKLQLNLKDIRINKELKQRREFFSSLYNSFDHILESKEATESLNDETSETLSINELMQYIENNVSRCRKTVIMVNSLQSLEMLQNATKDLSEDIKKYMKVCYNNLNIEESNKLYILVNPDIEYLGNISGFSIVIFGDWIISDYVKTILGSEYAEGIKFSVFSIGKMCEIYSIIPERKDLAAVYQYIRINYCEGMLIEDMYTVSEIIAESCKVDMNYFKFIKCLEIFNDLAILKIEFSENGSLKVPYLNRTMKKNDLNNSLVYRKLQLLKKVLQK